MDLRKYKRVFTFGCSFTNYFYPTWANIAHVSMPHAQHINLGKSGGGNMFISNRITQANNTYEFCDTDLVMVMWSTLCREDRFHHNNWNTPGNIFTQDEYDDKFLRKYADPTGYLIRDLSIIDLTTMYMSTLSCDYFDMLSVPFDYQCIDPEESLYKDVLNTYSNLIDHFDKTTLLDYLGEFNGKLTYEVIMNSKPSERVDYHPHPVQYCDYLQHIKFPLTDESIHYAQESYDKALLIKTESDYYKVFSDLTDSYTKNTQWSIQQMKDV